MGRFKKISFLKDSLGGKTPFRKVGFVENIVGLTIESRGPESFVGEICRVMVSNRNILEIREELLAEVVGFKDNRVILMPLGDIAGVSLGSKLIGTEKPLTIRVGMDLIGRVVDALGRPMDGKGPIVYDGELPIYRNPPSPLERQRISKVLPTGVKVIDAFLTIGKGQRIGIFSGSGVGKSTLLGMIAKYGKADVNVIALIGERGREVREFIEKILGEEGLKKSIVVVATSDTPPVIRRTASFTAMTIAEYFRDKGMDVLLFMDSLTRFAMAQREIGIASGEPPTTRGYTPSVFSLLPKLLERAGTSDKGSITGIFTVLVEGSDMEEPVADAARAILDGHIVLSRDIASRAIYPSVDVLQSVSRVMPDIVDDKHYKLSLRGRELMAVYRDAEDLINIGAYKTGSNPKIDEAIKYHDRLIEFIKQDMNEHYDFEETLNLLERVIS